MEIASPSYICNLALIRLGEQRVINIETDDTERAIQCNLIYDHTRDEMLRDLDWNFAISRARLARLASDPIGSYDYEYQLPVSPFCLRVVNMINDQEVGDIEHIPSHLQQPNYRIEGGKLLTDEKIVNIRYVSRAADIALYDSLFVECLSLRLATKLALSLVQSTQLSRSVFTEFLIVRTRAAFRNSGEWMGQPDPTGERWIDVARSGAGTRTTKIVLQE